MPDASTAPVADTDPMIQQLLAKFSVPPAPPNLAPFTQAKLDVARQQQQNQVPEPPPRQAIPQNIPAAQVTPIFQAMTPDLMLFAALGGALTRTPIASTVENMTGFITGLQKGDAEATKQHLDEFNAQLDAAKAANQDANEQYKIAFDKYTGNSQKLKDTLSSIADAEGDTIMKYKLESGEFDEVYKIVDARERLNQQIQNHQDMIDLRVQGDWKDTTLHLKDGSFVSGQKNSITGGYRDTEGKDIDSSQVLDTLASVPVEALVTSDTAQRAAEQAWAGDYHDAVSSASGFGQVGNVNRGIIANAITDYGKKQGKSGADIAAKIAEFHGQLAAATTVGHVQGSTAQGAQELQQIAPFVKAVSDKIDRTRFPDINAIQLAVERGTGNADVIQLNGYIQTLRNAYGLVMTRGGRMTDQTRKFAKEMIDGTLATGQIDAALQAIQNEAAVAQSSAARAMQEVTGQPVTAPQAPGTGGGSNTTSKW